VNGFLEKYQSPRKKFYLSRGLNLIRPPDMKCAAVAMAVSIAFALQALAVLRPIFPAKAGPPFGSEAIKGNGSVPPAVKKASASLQQ
jgi:hypothetical protein